MLLTILCFQIIFLTHSALPAYTRLLEHGIKQKLNRISRDVSKVDQDISFDPPKIEDEDNPNSGYGPWGPWTKCDKHCGIGISTRERKCNDLENCHDEKVEVALCSRKACNKTKPSG